MKNGITRSSLVAFLMLFAFSFSGCEKTPKEEEEDGLYVKFMNETTSQYTITTIQIRPRGPVVEEQTPTNNWGQNLLTNGETIAPGDHVFFTLDIPSSHWSEYRLGVDDGNGNEIMLHTQENYSSYELPITHWGGDTRTVSVTIVTDQYSGQIITSGYSDWVGID